jgi:hypothetical protein
MGSGRTGCLYLLMSKNFSLSVYRVPTTDIAKDFYEAAKIRAESYDKIVW